MTISIWAHYDGQPPEVVDRASHESQADYLVREYRMAFHCREDYSSAKPSCMVWAGRKNQEPHWDMSQATRRWIIVSRE